MSYVLDALRKADAERERGTVPTLLSQPDASIDIDPPRRRPSPVLMGAVAALVLVAGGGLAWTLMAPAPSVPIQPDTPGPAPIRAEAPAVAVAQAEVPVPAQAEAPPPGPPAIARVERPAPRVAPPAAPPMPGADRAAMAEARRERPRAAPPGTAAPATLATATVAAPTTASPAPAPAAAAADPAPALVDAAAAPAAAAPPNRPVALTQLPASVRGELPQLTVGGSMYSDEPAARLVILNGQPYHERDVVAPGLTLELIQPRAAILEYHGYRIKLKL
jgi:general secretion pathway protein B